MLIEVIQQIEQLKENLLPLQERDEELIECIKQLKRSQTSPGFQDKIYTCSHTLEAVVTHLRSSLDREEVLKEKIYQQSKSITHMKAQLAESKAKSQLLES